MTGTMVSDVVHALLAVVGGEALVPEQPAAVPLRSVHGVPEWDGWQFVVSVLAWAAVFGVFYLFSR